mmetsp:Transcript_21990/g.62474  ORF Transcript_21990/g.62474 Transcript_21990/m.62474 type:complete len:399 (-) Transcript_21990:2-1198(-)
MREKCASLIRVTPGDRRGAAPLSAHIHELGQWLSTNAAKTKGATRPIETRYIGGMRRWHAQRSSSSGLLWRRHPPPQRLRDLQVPDLVLEGPVDLGPMLRRQRGRGPIAADALAAEHGAYGLPGRSPAHRLECRRRMDGLQFLLGEWHGEKLGDPLDPPGQVLLKIFIVHHQRPSLQLRLDDVVRARDVVEEGAVGIYPTKVPRQRPRTVLVPKPTVLGLSPEVVQGVQAVLRVPQHIDEASLPLDRLRQQRPRQVCGEEPGPRLRQELGKVDLAEMTAGADTGPLRVVGLLRRKPLRIDLAARAQIGALGLLNATFVIHTEEAMNDFVHPSRASLDEGHHEHIVRFELHLFEQLHAFGVKERGHGHTLVVLWRRHRANPEPRSSSTSDESSRISRRA